MQLHRLPGATSRLAGPAAERYKLKVNVGILSEEARTRGRVQDISVSGARIEDVDTLPPEGAEVRLGFSFYTHALPVPIRGLVVRHTETGGFAVEFERLDFRTQILMASLLPTVGTSLQGDERARLCASGHLEADLSPGLLDTCARLASKCGMRLEDWIPEQLERIVRDALEEERFD